MNPAEFLDAAAKTWPPARLWREGPFLLRDGTGGGSRVSAATAEDEWTGPDIAEAEAAMAGIGQPPLFMLRDGEVRLDAALSERGYDLMDPVVGYAGSAGTLAKLRPPPVTTFEVWPPLAAQAEIWAEGGIGPGRRAVMDRAPEPKVTVLGRLDESPAGTAFVAIHRGLAMAHAIEVRSAFRRRGLGTCILRAAAFWALDLGAQDIGVLVTEANAGARALYEGLGMKAVARYHYRRRVL